MEIKQRTATGGFERFRRRLTGTRWVKGLFRKRCVEKAPGEPGVVLIKVDGLAYRQIQQALAKNRMPFLRCLSQEKGHRLSRFYSGMPSSTPAVQGELFYGVKSSVPAISFYDRSKKKKFNLLLPGSAGEMARKLEKQGEPLLKGGSSYSNIYTGGADEARYCTQTMTLRSIRHLASSVKLFILLAAQPVKFFWMIGYAILEAGIAVYDFTRGVGEGKNIFKELKFIPTRVLVCILLRELIRTRVKMDVRRGIKVVHATFLGYDEQAHRRGPDSAFAHWTLKGIDGVIEDIYRAAQDSKCRGYRLIVYSDHGQEAAVAYEKRSGKTIQEAVAEVASSVDVGGGSIRSKKAGTEKNYSADRARGLWAKGEPKAAFRENGPIAADNVRVEALGPIGHIYFPMALKSEVKKALAEALVKRAHIPLVLYHDSDSVEAVNGTGSFSLPAQGGEAVGKDHPHIERVTEDLAQICRHPKAGDLVIFGWRPGFRPVTFATENGAHGGPGKEETSGFLLMPPNNAEGVQDLRPLELRVKIFEMLGIDPDDPLTASEAGRRT